MSKRGCLIKRGKIYYAVWYIGSERFAKSTGCTDKREAEKELRRIMAPIIAGDELETLTNIAARIEDRQAEIQRYEDEANPPPNIKRAWITFVNSPARPDSGEATLAQYESEWKRFERWLDESYPEIIYLHQVEHKHAEEYAADLQAAKFAASTYNQHIGFLALLWRTLAAAARLDGNPWDNIARRKLDTLKNRKQALTPGQFDALLLSSESEPDFRDLFIILAWTGQRLVDGVMLVWGAVDFARNVITLAPRKTARRQGKVVHIPLFPAAREVLDRRQEGKPVVPSGYVFPELVQIYEQDRSAVSKRIRSLLEAAGIETTVKRSDRSQRVSVYGAHSFRHLAVTAFASAGMPSAMIKAITGHATDAMQEHYVQIGAQLAGEIAGRISNASTVAPLSLTEGLQEDGQGEDTQKAADPIQGKYELLAGKLQNAIEELADRLNSSNWETIKQELKELAKERAT